MSQHLDLFTIYERPKDYPNHFVVRRWSDGTASYICLLANSLEEARRLLPPGLYNIGRYSEDDPVIVETWL